MRILRCIRSLDPALGGPQEAVRQSCLGLGGMGHSVEIICLDEPDAPWIRDYPAKVYALGPTRMTFRAVSSEPYQLSRKFMRWMRTYAGKYDAIIVDQLWQFTDFATWFVLRKDTIPYFIYPHGTLDPWYKNRFPAKHVKKWLYWLLIEYRVLRDARAVLYTSEQEKALARQSSFWPYQAEEAVVGLPIEVLPGDLHYQDYRQRLFFKRFPE